MVGVNMLSVNPTSLSWIEKASMRMHLGVPCPTDDHFPKRQSRCWPIMSVYFKLRHHLASSALQTRNCRPDASAQLVNIPSTRKFTVLNDFTVQTIPCLLEIGVQRAFHCFQCSPESMCCGILFVHQRNVQGDS